MKKVAIYSRKSKETDTGESIKNQIQICKDYFLRKGEAYIFETFQDEGFSGSNTNRPEFQRMMMLAKAKEFDIIACYKVDRIGRNIIDFMNTFDELEKNDITLVSVTEGFDPSTPAGRMMMTMIAGFAEMERMNIAQRVKDNMTALAKLGRWSGGTPPTGYKSVRLPNGNKTAMYLEFIPEYREKLETAFKKIAEGYTIRQTAKLLDIPVKTLINIINNPTYCQSDELSKKYLESLGFEVFGELNGLGYLAYNRRPRAKSGKKLFNAKGMLVTVSRHEAPINSELWIAANEQIKKRGQEAKPRVSQFSFLAHKVKCACGSGMFINPGHMRQDGTRKYYFCCSSKKYDKTLCSAKRIDAKFLEEDILEMLINITRDKSLLESYINSKKAPQDYKGKIKVIKDTINKNNKILNSLTEKLVLLEGSAINILAQKMNSISKETDDLKQQLVKLEQKQLLDSIDFINTDILQDRINYMMLKWNELSMCEKQAEINYIIKEIQWNGENDFHVIFNA